MLVDSHCHLDFADFENELEAVVERAALAGVERMVTISTRIGQFDRIRAITERFANVFCSIGTHPHNAGEEPDIAVEHIVELSGYRRVVAIGEAGLDFHYDRSPRDVQERVFRTHIAAARQTGLPLVIHAREADAQMIRILREEHESGAFSAVLHCFSAGRELALVGMELGFYISFSGILTFKKADEIRAIAADMPADRLLVETDAPYLAPVPNRGQRNEPAYVAHTAKVLAQVRQCSFGEICRTTGENFQRVFSRAAAEGDG